MHQQCNSTRKHTRSQQLLTHVTWWQLDLANKLGFGATSQGEVLFARRGSSEAPAALPRQGSAAEFLRRVEDDRAARERRLQVSAPVPPLPHSGPPVPPAHPARRPRLLRGTSTCTRPTGLHRMGWQVLRPGSARDHAATAQIVRKMQQQSCRPAVTCCVFHEATECFDTCSWTQALLRLITCDVCRCIHGSTDH